jgi:hypothetical protein
MIPEEDLARLPWQKSSQSGDACNCVEVVVVQAGSQ